MSLFTYTTCKDLMCPKCMLAPIQVETERVYFPRTEVVRTIRCSDFVKCKWQMRVSANREPVT